MYIDRIVYSYTVYIYLYQYLWVAVDFLQASVEQLKTLICEESQAPFFRGFFSAEHGDFTMEKMGIFHHEQLGFHRFTIQKSMGIRSSPSLSMKN
jgi:hypothetical protein